MHAYGLFHVLHFNSKIFANLQFIATNKIINKYNQLPSLIISHKYIYMTKKEREKDDHKKGLNNLIKKENKNKWKNIVIKYNDKKITKERKKNWRQVTAHV